MPKTTKWIKDEYNDFRLAKEDLWYSQDELINEINILESQMNTYINFPIGFKLMFGRFKDKFSQSNPKSLLNLDNSKIGNDKLSNPEVSRVSLLTNPTVRDTLKSFEEFQDFCRKCKFHESGCNRKDYPCIVGYKCKNE